MRIALLLLVGCSSPAERLFVGAWENQSKIYAAEPGVVHIDIEPGGTWSGIVLNPDLSWSETEEEDGLSRFGGTWSLQSIQEPNAEGEYAAVLIATGPTGVLQRPDGSSKIPILVGPGRLDLDLDLFLVDDLTVTFVRRER
ncbi:MAG: hypothetical protein AAGD14_01245 [Planctomycetota bacterium]